MNPLFFMAPILDLKKNPGYQMFKQILESCISDNDDMIDEEENKLIDTLIESKSLQKCLTKICNIKEISG